MTDRAASMCVLKAPPRRVNVRGHDPRSKPLSDQELTRPCGQRPPRTDQERFFQRCAERDCGFETPCWVWLYFTDRDGYGVFKIGRKREGRAHRWAYEHFVGAIPEGLHVHHRCSTRACVNPEHLEAVTCRVNLMASTFTAASRGAAQTHCIHGHLFDAENTYVASGGARHCRECQRRRRREYYARRKATA